MLYGLLDEARERSERALRDVNAQGAPGGTHQARLERDVSAAEHAAAPRAAQRDRARPVLRPHRRREPGHPVHRPHRPARRRLRPQADRLARPRGAPVLRRHARATRQALSAAATSTPARRTVTGLDDEVFDLDKLSDTDRLNLSGEAALIAAVSSARTGRMADVVATIQAEQDRVIRSGPGRRARRPGRPGHRQDGRRAAPRRLPALHAPPRARAPRRPGHRAEPHVPALHQPGPAQSLGETDVVLRTLGDAVPRRARDGHRDPAAVVKGDERMAEVLRRAVRNPQRVPQVGHRRRRRRHRRPAAPRRDPARPRPRPRRCAGRTTWPASSSSPRC